MGEVMALTRESWVAATSYRLGFAISLGGVIVGIVPMYFVAGAIQPVVADSIRTEGGHYFGFLLVGFIAYGFLASTIAALPAALGSRIGSGTLEAMLNTPARIPSLLVGFHAYPLLWTGAKSLVMAAAGAALGAAFAWPQLAFGTLIVLLIVLVHAPFGLLSAAFVLMFRTSTPLNNLVLSVSMLLGGVYYSTSVIPSWMGMVSQFVPLTYSLRALRRVMLDGRPILSVSGDVATTMLFGAVLWAVGLSVFLYALRYSRRAGTLSHY